MSTMDDQTRRSLFDRLDVPLSWAADVCQCHEDCLARISLGAARTWLNRYRSQDDFDFNEPLLISESYLSFCRTATSSGSGNSLKLLVVWDVSHLPEHDC